MTELFFAILCAVVALFALTGWTVVNVKLSMALLPMANALKVVSTVSDRDDQKIASMVERWKWLVDPREKAQQTQPFQRDEQRFDPMAQAFASAEHGTFIGEQPAGDGEGMEIAESA